MTTFYLRIEGVNLSNFVLDTQDLSTIRGGSLLLLRAVERVARLSGLFLESISTGASAGLFRFSATNIDEARKILRCVQDYLRRHPQLKHATFVADILPATSSFTADRGQLLAMNRWQQMQAPSFAIPSESAFAKETYAVCQLDHVRPALRIRQRGDTTYRVSRSVAVRRDYGRKMKYSFYLRQLSESKALRKAAEGLKFTHDLTEIADRPDEDNLSGKIALIYLDGNKFGTLQRACSRPEDLAEFDTKIKSYRRKMLASLLETIRGDKRWFSGDKLRFETLLWGGDEITWVVPAWMGWWTLGYFFEYSRAQNWNWNGTPLTHSAGLVFCHHNAPIHRINTLAHRLAERCKAAQEGANSADQAAYLVLESFDHAGLDLEVFLKTRYRGKVNWPNLFVNGDGFRGWASAIEAVKETLPKRRIFSVLHSLVEGGDIAAAMCSARNGLENASALNEFVKLASPQREEVAWLHLAELWDYVGV